MSQATDPNEVLEQITDPGTLAWVDLLAPTPGELKRLGASLGLGTTGLEDALAEHERPKVARHTDHLSFTAYATALTETGGTGHGDRLRVARVSGFVLPHALITVRPLDGVAMDEVVGVWEDNADLLRYGPGALLYGLLDYVADSHFATIQALDERLELSEDDLLDDHVDPAFVRTLYGLRKDLVRLRRIVLPMREIVSGLLRHRNGDADELERWYDDLYDHVLRAGEWTESLRDMVSSQFETHLSLQDIRLNVVMKKLAAWAAIIAVPTAVTGWFGQNVPYPGFADALGLWESAGLITVLSVGLYVVFRRRDWL